MSDLDRIEAEAVAAAVGAWGGDVERLKRAVLSLYHAKGGTLTEGEMRALLARLDLPAPPRLGSYVTRAARAGDARVPEKTALHVMPAAAGIAASIEAKPGEALAEARRRLAVVGDLSNLASVLTITAPLTRSVADMGAAAQYAVHRSANEAVMSAAAQAGAKTVFVPERDACVDCIEQGGQTDDDGFELPPLHPWCRCEVQTYDDPDVPLALKREAIRSVLRGFSLPSESEAERLRAAAAMLKKRPQAPESVKAYARRAVAEGRFPRSRQPGGDL
jgi:hypothetical protein